MSYRKLLIKKIANIRKLIWLTIFSTLELFN